MLTDSTNEPRSIEEGYSSATGASHLRIEAHRSGPADIIAAAGMSPYHTGMALMRLRSEWDRAAKPVPPTADEIGAAAGSMPVEPVEREVLVAMSDEQIAEAVAKLGIGEKQAKTVDWRASIKIPNPHAGLVRSEQDGTAIWRKPARVAEIEAQRWHQHELGILFQSLKTLPQVRRELEHWIGGENAPRVVAEVLSWWLAPICKACGGCGKRIVHGTGGRSSGKPCPDCRYSATTGQRAVPFGGTGRRLVNHITHCYHTATSELRETLKKHRSTANIKARDQEKKDAQIARLRRADEETKADAVRDREADSKQVSESMAARRLRGKSK